jgi:hypothetical protein
MDYTSLAEDIRRLARELGVEEDSFLCASVNLADPSVPQQILDGLTLAFVTYCYHHHPRGENVYELMELSDQLDADSPDAAALDRRIEEAAALQIPFIVSLNRLLEEYYGARRRLEALIRTEQ